VLRERFGRPLDRSALALSESTAEDLEILPADLWGSRVHARMLGEAGLLPAASVRRLDRALRELEAEAALGRFHLDPRFEDVHLNVEAELTRRLGADGERLHTGRSRNDQVATDLAVYLRGALLDLEEGLGELLEALVERARSDAGQVVVPGWTHQQPAQRVYVGQILGTHALRFQRDLARLSSVRARLTDCPLGSGALAGSSLPLDRERTAHLLGFERPGRSSLDGVSDRDAPTETLAALALFGVHASSLAEELVLGSMPELGRVRLADPFVTTSSLMPHKRNPDLAELLRAEAAPAIGRLVSALTLLKGLPLAYNRDLQVGKPLLFAGVARARLLLDLLPPMVATAEFRPGRVDLGSEEAETGSVELVDRLVEAGVPFRAAHRRVARFLTALERRGETLRELPPSLLNRRFPELKGRPFRPASPTEEPERRRTVGGSAWREVEGLLREVDRSRRSADRAVVAERRRLARLRSELDRPPRALRRRSPGGS
jgi:argininosuccinate lyase